MWVLEIVICVGSSCHLKGSHGIINKLESLIEEYNMEDRVVLKASFCMGNCTQGVCATLNGRRINYLTIDNVDEFFQENIIKGAAQ